MNEATDMRSCPVEWSAGPKPAASGGSLAAEQPCPATETVDAPVA